MNDDVMREFLVSLGFRVDEIGMKKFSDSVEKVTKGVMQAGLAVAATATGIIAGVAVISSQMEKLYYASQRTGETVGNLMALRYAAGQIGLTADQAQGALEGFARTLRLNPGTNNLLSSLGVQGNSPEEKFNSFIAKAAEMKPYVAAAYASLFGIDPDTLLMLEQGQAQRLAQEEAYKKRLASFGIDPEQAASDGKDFDNSIREVKDDFQDLWIVIESKLTPVLTPLINKFTEWSETHAGDVAQSIADAVQHLADWINSVNWTKAGKDINDVVSSLGGARGILLGIAGIKLASIIAGVGGLAGVMTNLAGALALVAGYKIGEFFRDGVDKDVKALSGGKYWSLHDFVTGTDRTKLAATGGYTQEELDSLKDSGGARLTPPRGNDKSNVDAPALFSKLEAQFSLPTGILDKEWDIESGRGKNMLSPKGARGHFGFMDATAKQYGLADPDNLAESARAAAHVLHDLMDKFGGDVSKALAAYNWGEGNLGKDIARYGDDWRNHLPLETANYIQKVAGSSGTRLGASGASTRSMTLTQTTQIHVTGSADPQGTARTIGGEQDRVNGDLVRNFRGAFS